MMHLRRSVAVILLLISCAVSVMASVRTVTIPFAARGPALKGDLSDPLWARGALLSGFTSVTNDPDVTQQTQARVLYDSNYLYLGIRCDESNPAGMVKRVKEHDGQVWQDDCIELVFDTANGHHIVYHVMVNSIGAIADEKCMAVERSDTGWISHCRVKTGKAAGAWTMEVAVPFKDFGVTPCVGLTWGLNVCRARYAGTKEYSAWSPSPGGFVQPQNLGHIVLGDKNGRCEGIELVSWGNLDSDSSTGGRNAVECIIPTTDHTPETHDVSLRGYVNGKPTINIKRKVSLTTGESATIEIPYKPSGPGSESYVLTVSRDGRTEFKATHPSMSIPKTSRVWQLRDPLFKELLSKNPPGDQKDGIIYWFHSGVESNLNPFAKEYGLRFSLDEAYKELRDTRFLPITQSAALKSDLFQRMEAKYDYKILFQPDYRGSRDKGAPEIDGLPYVLDPRSRRAYFDDLRTGITLGRQHMWGIYTQDEIHEKATEAGVKFFSQMKDTYPCIREVDEQVKKEFGYGKYGMPMSPTDENPFRWIAYRKWTDKQLLDWQKEVYEVARQLAPELRVISMDPVEGHTPVEMDQWTPYIDITTHQLYPSANPNRQEFGFVTKFAADLTGKPTWPCAHVENYAYPSTAEETRELMSQVMRNGGKGFHLYIPDVRGVSANSGDTFLTKYGSPERYRAIKEILDTTYEMNEVAIPSDPDCAIFYSEDHYQSFSERDYGRSNEPEFAYTFLGPVARTWFKIVNDNMVEDGKADLSRYKAVFVPAAKYERRAVVEKLIRYVENGGTLVLGGTDCFRSAPDGSSLDDVRQRLVGRASASGSPLVIRNRIGKGKVIVFTTSPFTAKAIADPAWQRTFKVLAKSLGLRTGRDIWRFKFPEFKGVYQPDPSGVCLTGNFVKWHQERPLDICNVTSKGTYSYSTAPDGIADRGDAGVGFDTGKLTDRKRAPSVPKAQLKPDDFIVTWKSGKPVDIAFDLADSYAVNQAHLWYSGQLPAITVEGSTDGHAWISLASSPKQQPTQDVLDLVLSWKPSSEFRFIRLSFAEREPGQAMTLAECEIWAKSPK
jgi:hypothetical protein